MGITIRQLSRLCGVSTATVSLVLSNKDRGRVGARKREEILRLAEQHSYQSNPVAKGLAEGRTYRIALVFEGALSDHAIIGQFSFYDRLGLMAKSLRETGYAIEIVQTDPAREQADLRRDMSRVAADGFVLMHWKPSSAAPLLHALRDAGRPAVACGTALRDREFAWTDVDRGAAFADATLRLLRDGHRKIALLDCAVGHVYIAEKKKAFLNTLRDELGMDASNWVFLSRGDSYEDIVELTTEAVRKMPSAKAFLITDNFYAEAVEYALRLTGMQPGKDCRLIGLGDTFLADRCKPRLSHYSLRVAQQVQFCVRALLEQIQSPQTYVPHSHLFGPHYIERET